MTPQHPLIALSKRYPQLVVPIEEGAKTTQLYVDLVRRGAPVGERIPDFSLDPRDSLRMVDTPAGPVEVLTLRQRDDFEHAVQALAYRCEPQPIPASMGAITLIGLIDWGRVADHKQDWIAAGNSVFDWPEEYRAFVGVRDNIRGSLIILSSGPYSAVTADEAGRDASDWIDDSIAIRTFHELAHVVSRRLYPDNEQAVRDEVLADYVGLVAAYGRYDDRLAKLFLGLEGDGIREGGRLRNYVGENNSLEEAERRARTLIDEFSAFDVQFACDEDCDRHFAALRAIESECVGL